MIYLNSIQTEYEKLDIYFAVDNSKDRSAANTTSFHLYFFSKASRLGNYLWVVKWKIQFDEVLIPTTSGDDVQLGVINDEMLCIVLGNHIAWLNKLNGSIIQKHTYGNTVIEKLLLSPDQKGILILYYYYQFVPIDLRSNLLKIDFQGNLIWSAGLYHPKADDVYTSMQIVDGSLRASTWGCLYCSIDLEKGDVVNSVFTK